MKQIVWKKVGWLMCLSMVFSGVWAQNGADFQNYCKERAQSAASIAVEGADGWCFLKSELRHLGAGDFWGDAAAKTAQCKDPKAQDPLQAIVAYDKALKAEKIKLLVVPVPPKAIIYPEKLADGNFTSGTRYDASLQRFYQELKKQGVEVLDLTPLFLSKKKGLSEPLYCLGDSHFSGEGAKVVAQAIAGKLKSYGISGSKSYTEKTSDLTFTGDLYKSLAKRYSETRKLHFISGDPVTDKASPVLLFGDSHTLVFDAGGDMFASQAGLASNLACALKMPVEVIGVRGSGATPSRINVYRRSKAAPSFLKQKKVFVWCLSAREFTEASSWSSQVPLK